MEITGLKCSHKECGAREWADSDAALDWVPVVITRPRDGVNKLVHYCPEHGAGLITNTDFSEEKLTTGQQRIVYPPAPPMIDAALQRAVHPAYDIVGEMDRANEADLARAGATALARVTQGQATQATETVVVPDLPWGPPTPADGSTVFPVKVAIDDQHPSTDTTARTPRQSRNGRPRNRTTRTDDGIVRAAGRRAGTKVVGLLMLIASLSAVTRGGKYG